MVASSLGCLTGPWEAWLRRSVAGPVEHPLRNKARARSPTHSLNLNKFFPSYRNKAGPLCVTTHSSSMSRNDLAHDHLWRRPHAGLAQAIDDHKADFAAFGLLVDLHQ